MVRYNVTSSSQIITRHQVYDIPVTCVLGRNGDPDNEVEPAGRTARPRVGEGEFDVAMYIYEYVLSFFVSFFSIQIYYGTY